MECRVLPMFQEVEQGIRGVQRVLDITNACLTVLGRREEKLNGKFTIDPGDRVIEEYEERV
jgi:hypothetical protein